MASNGRGGRIILYFIFCCHGVSFLLFCRGFMLKRVVIPEFSQCHYSHTHNTTHLQSCNAYPRPFKRVLWLLIDALRYDFMVYDETLNPPPTYRNKMPYVRDLLETQPANARLFKFIADPPTTTMQRLKALTTGSLPTFIDIGSNFNSYAVSEDSLPYQAKLNNRNVTFIGDDTWLGLYPDMLTKTFDYPSLNVQDLDTVDNGVMENLGPELEKNDAEIVIGHMLGVDHVGHTYGPSHWTMGEKLTQMNDYIRDVFTHLVDEDTVVFVFGDHGMSPTGDHGGETGLETDAALLVYSSRPLFDPLEPVMGREVYQIDLVPTTAMAVGLPIPFSNLGTVVPEVLLPFRTGSRASGSGTSDGYSGRVTPEFLEALRINAEQLHKYLKTYTQYSQDFPAETFKQLESDFNRVVGLQQELLSRPVESQSQHDMTHVASEYFRYTREVKVMCHSIWAKFDGALMNQGIGLFLLTVVATPLMLLDVERSSATLRLSVPVGLKMGTVLTGVWTVFTGVDFSLFGGLVLFGNFLLISLVVIILTFGCYSVGVISKFMSVLVAGDLLKAVFKIRFLQLLSVCVVLLHAVFMLSNSFILYEADMLAFFIQSLVFGFALRTLQKLLSSHREPGQISAPALVKSLSPHVTLMACVRVSKLFYACRDLQIQDGCESTTFILSFASAREFIGLPLTLLRYALSAVALLTVVVTVVLYFRKITIHKFLSRYLTMAYEFGFVLCVVCVIVHWAVQTLPQSTLRTLPHWQHITAPRVAYAISITVIALCVVCPFKRYLPMPVSCEDVPTDDLSETRSNVTTTPHFVGKSVPRQRNRIQDQSEHLGTDVATPTSSLPSFPITATWGPVVLVTAIMVTSLWVSIAMLLNDGIALSAVLTALQMVLALKLLQHSQESLSLEVCVLWALLSCHSFFSFGHHATVTSLRFEAGFVGIHGDITKYNIPLAATLVGLNTIASQILFGLGFPLLLVVGGNGLSRPDLKPSDKLLPAMILYSVLHSIKLLVTMLAASLHRRHLMVWWVFAPRFLYEGAFQATTDITMILTSCLVGRLEHALAKIKN